MGYNVRWGIAPDKLHSTYQRWADQGTQLELRALTVGQSYWVAIESFDESGHIVGMLSIRHMMQEQIAELEQSVDALQNYASYDGATG